MFSLSRLEQLLTSPELPGVLIELAVIWLCVYAVVRFLRGTRGAGVLKGVAFLAIVLTLLIRVLGSGIDAFARLNFIYDRFMGLLAILLIVVFQPELRQAMIRLGRTRLFRGPDRDIGHVVDAVAEAVTLLARKRCGALVAIERSVGLGGLVDAGVVIDAEASSRLLQAIFWPTNPLHDLGVVIRNGRVAAACVQFPLAEEGLTPTDWGSRHRAALGLTFECDALVVVVSEEDGTISFAEMGRMTRGIPPHEVASQLRTRLGAPGTPGDPPASPPAAGEPAPTGPARETPPAEPTHGAAAMAGEA